MGKIVMKLENAIRESVYQTLVETETKLGRPVTRNEVFSVHKQKRDF
jgi:hypothetical protein